MKIAYSIVWRLCLLGLGSWVVAALLYSPILPEELRGVAALTVGALTLLGLLRLKAVRVAALLVCALALVAYWRLTPSNERDWQTDLALLPRAEISGDEVTIYNVRDFSYRTETDYDPRYVTKKVRLSELSSLDLFASYWDGFDIAHIFVSFGFANNEKIAISVEARKTKAQSYSTIGGFFRNYELIYVVAEERDLVGLRTVYRQPNEQVHLLRLAYFKDNAIQLFRNYLERINSLNEQPQFYGTLRTNCTTQVLANAQLGGTRKLKYDWRVLLSGHMPEYLFDLGSLHKDYSLAELMQRGLVNPRAQDTSDARLFSEMIRVGVPQPTPFATPPAS